MKTALAIVLLGLFVACVPTSAHQSHLRNRLVRAADDTEHCQLKCDGDARGNVVIMYKYFHIIISRNGDNTYIMFVNTERNIILDIDLRDRIAALIDINTGGAFIFDIPTGMGTFAEINFNVKIDFSGKVDATALYQWSLDIHTQVIKLNKAVFNFFLSIIAYVRGASVQVAFGVSVEVSVKIEASFNVLLGVIQSGGQAAVGNALDIIQIIAEFACKTSTYVKLVVGLLVRMPPIVADTIITNIVAAARAGGAVLQNVAFQLEGAYSALGNVEVNESDTHEWTISLPNGSAYKVTIAKEAHGKRWSMTFVPLGLSGGALEIAAWGKFLFIYCKKHEWVTVIAGGRIGVFNMLEGCGVVISGIHIGIVDENQGINIKKSWNYFLNHNNVSNLQAGLQEAVDVSLQTEISSTTLTSFDNDLRSGEGSNKYSARFIAAFEVYIAFLKEDEHNTGMLMCFYEQELSRFQEAFGAVILRVVQVVSLISFDTISSTIFAALKSTADIGAGVSIDFGASIHVGFHH